MLSPNEALVIGRFAKDTEGFVLTVLHEAGDYRHLRFQRPGERWGSTDIHTWPEGLTTAGDMSSGWMFERSLGFFQGRPNLHYWQEKLDPSGRRASEEFSAAVTRDSILSAADEFEIPDDFRADLVRELRALADEVENEHADVAAAVDHIASFVFECEDEDGNDLDVRFVDAWEANVTDYCFHFIWACNVLSTAARWLRDEDARVIRKQPENA